MKKGAPPPVGSVPDETEPPGVAGAPPPTPTLGAGNPMQALLAAAPPRRKSKPKRGGKGY